MSSLPFGIGFSVRWSRSYGHFSSSLGTSKPKKNVEFCLETCNSIVRIVFFFHARRSWCFFCLSLPVSALQSNWFWFFFLSRPLLCADACVGSELYNAIHFSHMPSKPKIVSNNIRKIAFFFFPLFGFFSCRSEALSRKSLGNFRCIMCFE